MNEQDLKYLRNLSKLYPSVASAATEIINLKAILSLPKGTEHFMTDIHGEYEQFQHILKNGSGAIKRKIEEEFGYSLSEEEKRSIATLIYYPEQKLKQLLGEKKNVVDWYKVTLYQLIRVCKRAAFKYTRSKVRKSLPKDFEYVIEELLLGRESVVDQEQYYSEIINSVIETGRARELVIELCNLIRRLVVDHLHVVGDIFDRGPFPNLVMDSLVEHHSVDIQWGNHDVSWIGAASGNEALICTVIRISAKYGNLNLIEDSYGINLIPLARLAMEQYGEDPCERFKVDYREDNYDVRDVSLDEKMHKAITIMQLKLEGQMIKRHPEYAMDNRLFLDKIDINEKHVTVDGISYPLLDREFPTIDWNDPFKLSPQEEEVMERLVSAFTNCEKLQRHVKFLLSKGSLYKIYNGNLLYHGCVPLNDDGSFTEVEVCGQKYAGKKLYDVLDSYVRKGYYSLDIEEKKAGLDVMWFLWLHRNSPVYGKEKMTTFERYFVEEEITHKEPKNKYYDLINSEEEVNKILEEFGLKGDDAHIINGHIPIEVKHGESPIKCNGKLLIIDGGFSKAYQAVTGIAGYTLVYNSHGLVLVAHEPFESVEKVVLGDKDVVSHTTTVQNLAKRKLVKDTDMGKLLMDNITDIEALLEAYTQGIIGEKI